MDAMRALGPVGRQAMEMGLRRRISDAFPPTSHLITSNVDISLMSKLLHASWTLPRGGEEAVHAILQPGAYARRSLLSRVRGPIASDHLCPPPSMPISLIYGDPEWDWMTLHHGMELCACLRRRSGQRHVQCTYVEDTSHMLMMDSPHGLVARMIDSMQTSGLFPLSLS